MLGLVNTLWRARLIAPMRPDRYWRMGAAMRRVGMTVTVGFAAAAGRCPDRPGLIDELGTLTWKQLDDRCDAFAAALQALPGEPPKQLGIMCRDHRGFIEALVAANRIGADALLLNTSFAGPALAEVVPASSKPSSTAPRGGPRRRRSSSRRCSMRGGIRSWPSRR
jgi:non-ribosomal peptide synthetase component F